MRFILPPRRALISVVLLFLGPLSAFAGVADKPNSSPNAPSRSAHKSTPRQRHNVILITIDTLRADHVGCYGAENVKTPTLDALAHDGIVYERAISQVPLTWPSHAVILTGTFPFQNGVQDLTGQPLATGIRSVAQTFKQAGFATGAVVSAFVLDRSWGLSRGFDFYDDAFSAKTFAEKDTGLVDRRAGESVPHAIDWIKRTAHRPFFLWLHLYDPHSPYDPPEPYKSEYRGHLYDGEIAYADHELGNLISALKQNHLYDSTVLVVLSDHGESLGEHGEDEHGFFIYNSTIHVPLIVKPPVGSGIRAGGRREEPVETAAVAPTLLQLAGIKPSGKPADQIFTQFQSPVLAGLGPADKAGSSKSYSETFYPFSSFGWSPLHSIETAKFHFIEAPNPELYNLNDDPKERRNLATEEPATVASLRNQLNTTLARQPFHRDGASASNLDPEAQAKLRALGYFGFRAAISPESLQRGLSDPKDKLWEFNAILNAEDAFQRKEDDRAVALLEEVQRKDPNIYIIPFLLGESALRQQNWQAAADQLQRCLKLNPNFDNAMTALARALAKLQKPDEAFTWLSKAVESNPQNYQAHYQIGLLKAESDPRGAAAELAKSVEIQPNFSGGQRELGMNLFQQQDYPRAASHLEKAISLGLEDARLHNFLGICYNHTDRSNKAVTEFESAIRLDPNLAEAHLNLAFALQTLHRLPRAREEYATACKLEQAFCKYVPAN